MGESTAIPPNPANAPSASFFGSVGITAGMRVLDVGCGSGDLSRLVAQLAGPDGEVVAIDRADEALAVGRNTDAGASAAPIRYHQADLSANVPDELGHFDAIVGRRVLMYLPNPAQALRSLVKAARRGAIFAFQEHARAGLPTGLGELPLHRQLYRWMWNTVAAEGGDVALAFKLVDLLEAHSVSVEQARSEAISFLPGQPSFLPVLSRAMLPRLVERGVASAKDVDLDTLPQRIEDERRTTGGTIVWDLAFLVSGRCR